mmetsp:Transcript_2971/g.8365  ORF Transcript_2971/g.8365 Transcript_2971/m.8365 type:complete len:91 (-) Transcript_2971:226-498(-)
MLERKCLTLAIRKATWVAILRHSDSSMPQLTDSMAQSSACLSIYLANSSLDTLPSWSVSTASASFEALTTTAEEEEGLAPQLPIVMIDGG